MQTFRDLIRVKNILDNFSNFEQKKLPIENQEFEDYKSKYLDLYDSSRKKEDKASILNDIDFELELIQKDEINVSYILKLLGKLKKSNKSEEQQEKEKSNILSIINSNPQLRSKRELVEKFINDILKTIESDKIEDEFFNFIEAEREENFKLLVSENNLNFEKIKSLLQKYIYTEKEPQNDEVFDSLEKAPSILKRKSVVNNIIDEIKAFVNIYY